MYCKVIGELVVLTNVCAGMLVVPLAAAPVMPAGMLQVHAMVTLDEVDERLTADVCPPEQMV